MKITDIKQIENWFDCGEKDLGFPCPNCGAWIDIMAYKIGEAQEHITFVDECDKCRKVFKAHVYEGAIIIPGVEYIPKDETETNPENVHTLKKKE